MKLNTRRNSVTVELLVLGLISLAALVLRLYYVNVAVVDIPIRGDALQYRAYAWNLARHHIFSGALPYATHVVSDSFRDPGYPTFLALLDPGGTMGGEYLRLVLDVQCLLSALTVWMFAILARRWIGFVAATGTAIVLGLWPHTITLAGYQLSETLLGFLVTGAIFMTDETLRRLGTWRPALAGLAFALAGLTNAVVAPFAPLLAAVMIWRDPQRRRVWAVLLVAALLPITAWSLRSASMPAGDASAGNRAKMNLVQGSWPEYHAASLRQYSGDARSIAVMGNIDSEYQTIRMQTTDGLMKVAGRLGSEPARYLRWYLSKPAELWGWEIGVGSGDIYVYPTYNSPLLTQPVLRGIVGMLFFLWPFLFLLAIVGAGATLFPAMEAPTSLRVAGALGVWITVIYGLLQSDVRYSTPFRGIEMVLAAFAIQAGCLTLRRRRDSTQHSGRPAS